MDYYTIALRWGWTLQEAVDFKNMQWWEENKEKFDPINKKGSK